MLARALRFIGLTTALTWLSACLAEFPDRGRTTFDLDARAPDGALIPVEDVGANDAASPVGDGFAVDAAPARDAAADVAPPARELVCDDELDNDQDGQTDCDDDDCAVACGLTCIVADLGSQLGEGIARASNEGADSVLASECGGRDGRERAWSWTAPEDGDYLFHTLGSEPDTVLYLLDGRCDAEVLECDDDIYRELQQADIRQSGLIRELSAGQRLVVVADGFGVLDLGELVLSIHGPGEACEAEDLGSRLGEPVAEGSNEGAPTRFAGGCAAPTNDVAFIWTAERSGSYVFDTNGSDFDTVLQVLRGRCGERAFCDDDGGFDRASRQPVTVQAGTTITLVVSGFSGATGRFRLNIKRL